jgi:hypothetical protein
VAGVLAAGYRLGGRRSGRLTAVTGVTALAVLIGLQHHPTVNWRVAVLAAVAATAPFAVLRRYPARPSARSSSRLSTSNDNQGGHDAAARPPRAAARKSMSGSRG